MNSWAVGVLSLLTIILLPPSVFATAGPSSKGNSKCWTEADIEPQSAHRERFVGRDARILLEALGGTGEAGSFDTLLVISGANVFGGTAVIAFKDGCAVGKPMFLSLWQYIDATEMLTLFRTNPELKKLDHFDAARVKALAEGGDLHAQLHLGLLYGRALGPERNRSASLDWLTRAAKRDFGLAMVALGVALSGPDWMGDVEAHRVGAPFPSDAFTDRARAYYWFNLATDSSDRMVRGLAQSEISGALGLMGRISEADRAKGRRLILEHESAPRAVFAQAVTLGSQTPEVFGAFDQKWLDEFRREVRNKFASLGHGPVQTTPEQAEAEIEEFQRADQEMEKQITEMELNGRLFRIPCGTVARVARSEEHQSQVEILSGRLKGKLLYVNTDDIVR